MKSMLLLAGAGLASLALFSCAVPSAPEPPPVEPRPEVLEIASDLHPEPEAPVQSMAPPSEEPGAWGLRELRLKGIRQQPGKPAQALEYKFYSRAGPMRHRPVKPGIN